jgi:hypothetical protein
MSAPLLEHDECRPWRRARCEQWRGAYVVVHRRLADRHRDAADVGVVGGDGALDERRVDNRLADGVCELVGGRVGDADAEHVRDALAVAHDVLGEAAADLGEGGGERVVRCRRRRL